MIKLPLPVCGLLLGLVLAQVVKGLGIHTEAATGFLKSYFFGILLIPVLVDVFWQDNQAPHQFLRYRSVVVWFVFCLLSGALISKAGLELVQKDPGMTELAICGLVFTAVAVPMLKSFLDCSRQGGSPLKQYIVPLALRWECLVLIIAWVGLSLPSMGKARSDALCDIGYPVVICLLLLLGCFCSLRLGFRTIVAIMAGLFCFSLSIVTHLAGLHFIAGVFVASALLAKIKGVPLAWSESVLAKSAPPAAFLLFFFMGFELNVGLLFDYHLWILAILAYALSVVIKAIALKFAFKCPPGQLLKASVCFAAKGTTELILMEMAFGLELISETAYSILLMMVLISIGATALCLANGADLGPSKGRVQKT